MHQSFWESYFTFYWMKCPAVDENIFEKKIIRTILSLSSFHFPYKTILVKYYINFKMKAMPAILYEALACRHKPGYTLYRIPLTLRRQLPYPTSGQISLRQNKKKMKLDTCALYQHWTQLYRRNSYGTHLFYLLAMQIQKGWIILFQLQAMNSIEYYRPLNFFYLFTWDYTDKDPSEGVPFVCPLKSRK